MSTQPHPFTLRQLQYVLAVADLLSFRKAALACHVSQPALSAQIAQVEELLGVALFERDHKRVLLTPAGALLIDRIRRLVVDADALVEAATRAEDPLASTLRIGVIPTIAPYLLPRLAPALRASFPRLVTLWTEDKTPILVARLAAGTLDAALLALEAELGDVETALVADDPFVLAMPVGHALSREPGPASLDDLHGTPVLLLDEGHCFRTQVLAQCARAELNELAWRATSLGTLVQMVAAGTGVTLLPALAIEAEAGRAAITIRPFAEPAPRRTLVLAWRAHSPLAPAFATLAEAMRKAAG